jgi:DNA-binding CsgD family transcriptional regulator
MLSFESIMSQNWKRVILYGVLLGAGTLALEWLDYARIARSHSLNIFVFLVAAAFLLLGIFVGVRAFGRRVEPAPFNGNPDAVASLGITPRELTVLQRLAAGRTNKEIAQDLDVAPDTVKTHVSRLFEKLDARRRTEAINKARGLGIVP